MRGWFDLIDRLLFFFLICFIPIESYAKDYYLEEMGCYVNPPESWTVLEVRSDKAVFSDTEESAFLIIRLYPAGEWKTVDDLASRIIKDLNASSEQDEFFLDGFPARFLNLAFETNGFSFYGHAVAAAFEKCGFAVISFADSDAYDFYVDFLLSALDSFRLSDEYFLNPGPVAQYIFDPDLARGEYYPVFVNNLQARVFIDREDIAVSQIIVNREMRVLSNYDLDAGGINAWKRAYQIIYRDNYTRLSGLFTALHQRLLSDFSDPFLHVAILLDWVQQFTYERTGDLADFLNPLECAVTASGDCDSRVLLLALLLDRLDIKTIMMVSSVYSHSMAGFDIQGSGARFEYDGVTYLVGETTDRVEPGLINAQMADPSGWIGIDFP